MFARGPTLLGVVFMCSVVLMITMRLYKAHACIYLGVNSQLWLHCSQSLEVVLTGVTAFWCAIYTGLAVNKLSHISGTMLVPCLVLCALCM